jgi:hypothetical protein
MERQISQQQAIYNQITNLAVRIFKLFSDLYAEDRSFCQVFFRYAVETSRSNLYGKVIAVSADVWTEISNGEEQARVCYGAAERAVLRREQ